MTTIPVPPFPAAPIRVFFPCSGLGRYQRGFETYTAACARALAGDPRLEMTVFGAAPAPGIPVRVVPCLARDGALARWLAVLHGRGGYYSEQASFVAAFIPLLVRGDPDVVYYGDLSIGTLCWHWRRLSGARFRLVYHNGGLTTLPFTRSDLVQQLTPSALTDALGRGEPASRQLLLPYGVDVPPSLAPAPSASERRALRDSLGLPRERAVVLSVGALNTREKRTDALLREMAALAEPRPFLCLLGQGEAEGDVLRRMAHELLGADGHVVRTVPHPEMARYYRAADVFVSAVTYEPFGLALVEAAASGVPIIVHDSPRMHELLGEAACYADVTRAGVLASSVAGVLADGEAPGAREARHRVAYERYSWDVLRDRYVAMFRAAVAAPPR